MNTIGDKIKVSVFGESHQPMIGVMIDGLDAGITLDEGFIKAELGRRRPGYSDISTPRKEPDDFVIVTGVFKGKTDGSPLVALCQNTDTKSKDYTPQFPRPSHADLAAMMKFQQHNDYRGGGMFSGRLTAPIVFAGAVIKHLLVGKYNINVSAKIKQIHNETYPALFDSEIMKAKAMGDSVGGIITGTIEGVKPGIGSPMFNSIESEISRLLFSIPAVKGVEFGLGFNFVKLNGSDANDQLKETAGAVEYLSNNNGGILGGLSTGEPIIVNVAIKPTPTISRPQSTIDLNTKQTVQHSFGGRHDPCIVPRAVVVVESALAIAIANLL
jgi:chorismate synthase